MFDGQGGAVLTECDVAGFAVALGRLPGDDDAAGCGGSAAAPGGQRSAAVLVDLVRALEELKSAAAAAQARVTARFAAGQRAAQRAAGVPARDLGKGIAAQVGLARRDSPVQGARHLGLAEALVYDMPHTLATLQAGQVSE